MIQIGDTWEIGRTVYYVDDKDKTLVKEARIKEVHEVFGFLFVEFDFVDH